MKKINYQMYQNHNYLMKKVIIIYKQNESEKYKRNKKSKNEKYNGDDLWRMGIICKKDCYGLSKDILSILDKNGYEWKIISSSYKIKYRKKQTEDTKNFN